MTLKYRTQEQCGWAERNTWNKKSRTSTLPVVRSLLKLNSFWIWSVTTTRGATQKLHSMSETPSWLTENLKQNSAPTKSAKSFTLEGKLVQAVQDGNLPEVRRWVAAGADENFQDFVSEHHTFPLCYELLHLASAWFNFQSH